jgi:hypothetical protein
MKLLSCFFLLFIADHSLAGIPFASHWDKLAPRYEKDFRDPSFSSLWGGLRRMVHWKTHKGDLIDLKPSGFREAFSVYVFKEKKRKDLFLFYPGIFGRPDGRISPQVIDALETLDVHVAAVPNIVAETYINARPIQELGSIDQERVNQTLLYDEVIKHIGRENILRIHVIAESLGTFQSLQVDRPFDSLTLLSTPLYLDRSLNRFDELIRKQTPVLENCTLWWKWPYFAWKMKTEDLPTSISESDKTCLGAWMIAESFVGAIKRTSEKVKLKSELSEIPKTFKEFVEKVLPEIAPLVEGRDLRLSVPYLLKKIPTKKERIYFLSTKDDFLNDLSEWEDVRKAFPETQERIYLFSWGGHSGPMAMDGFLEKFALFLTQRNE